MSGSSAPWGSSTASCDSIASDRSMFFDRLLGLTLIALDPSDVLENGGKFVANRAQFGMNYSEPGSIQALRARRKTPKGLIAPAI